MNNQSILIIGNGESILNNKLQNKIDAFDVVLRINNYRTTGYEKFLGTKTDIWFNGANSKLTTPENIPGRVVVAIPSRVFLKYEEDILPYVSKRINMKNEKFLLIPRDDILNYESTVGHARLTTGLYAIMWALKNYEDIYIYGFDFFINSKSHYYDSKLMNFVNENILNKGHKHDNQKERDFVNNLIDKNKIKRLVNIND